MRFTRAFLGLLLTAPLLAQLGTSLITPDPYQIPADSGPITIEVQGTDFQPGWQVLWNNSPRPTEYLTPYRLRVKLTEADTLKPSLSFVSVRDPASGQLVRAPYPVWVYVPLWNYDMVYDSVHSRFWVAVPDDDTVHGPAVAKLNPETGVVEKYVGLSIEPLRLAISSDGRYLYLAASGRIQRLDTQSLVIDLDFAMPFTDITPTPPTANAMAVAPDNPDVLVVVVSALSVSPRFYGTVVFDAGIIRGDLQSTVDHSSSCPGWDSEGNLVALTSSTVNTLSLGLNGVELVRSFPTPVGAYNCAYANELLYCGSGAVVDPRTGSYAGAFPANGIVAALPQADRLVFLDDGWPGSVYGAMPSPVTVFRLSTGQLVYSGLLPFRYGGAYGPLVPWGSDGLAWRDAGSNGRNTSTDRLFLFHIPGNLPVERLASTDARVPVRSQGSATTLR